SATQAGAAPVSTLSPAAAVPGTSTAPHSNAILKRILRPLPGGSNPPLPVTAHRRSWPGNPFRHHSCRLLAIRPGRRSPHPCQAPFPSLAATAFQPTESFMVPRYARPAMTAIWEPEARYRIWFEIEAHATEKLGELGVVPPSAAQALWDWWKTEPTIDVEKIDAIEAVTKHDVIAFLTWVADNVGEQARFMHQGMTSSDVLDTTLAVQL